MRQKLSILAIFALLAGCSNPETVGAVAPAGNDLHLYVSNQSFDQPTADLLVTVDGLVAFDGEAKVEGQHNWMERHVQLAAGSHRIEALERDTGTRMSHDFSLPAGQQRWVVVNYWNSMSPGEQPGFTITVHDEPVAFA